MSSSPLVVHEKRPELSAEATSIDMESDADSGGPYYKHRKRLRSNGDFGVVSTADVANGGRLRQLL